MLEQRKEILNSKHLNLTIRRLSSQVIENHVSEIDKSVIIGLQPRGTALSEMIHRNIERETKKEMKIGYLDTTFFRDDFRRRKDVLIPNETKINFSLEGLNVILVDDVVFTGRSVRSALDALVSFGRPSSVELLVLIDRRFSREIPIEPTYVGKSIDVIDDERVLVKLDDKKKCVILLNKTS